MSTTGYVQLATVSLSQSRKGNKRGEEVGSIQSVSVEGPRHWEHVR